LHLADPNLLAGGEVNLDRARLPSPDHSATQHEVAVMVKTWPESLLDVVS
jgi:hypothetical protein